MGSFEAGAVSAIVNIVNAQDVEYDVLTGISIGSVNSLGLS
jgi:predicted acylesterase/phospholipase RssA